MINVTNDRLILKCSGSHIHLPVYLEHMTDQSDWTAASIFDSSWSTGKVAQVKK